MIANCKGPIESRQFAQLDALVLHLLLVLWPEEHLDHGARLVHLHSMHHHLGQARIDKYTPEVTRR